MLWRRVGIEHFQQPIDELRAAKRKVGRRLVVVRRRWSFWRRRGRAPRRRRRHRSFRRRRPRGAPRRRGPALYRRPALAPQLVERRARGPRAWAFTTRRGRPLPPRPRERLRLRARRRLAAPALAPVARRRRPRERLRDRDRGGASSTAPSPAATHSPLSFCTIFKFPSAGRACASASLASEPKVPTTPQPTAPCSKPLLALPSSAFVAALRPAASLRCSVWSRATTWLSKFRCFANFASSCSQRGASGSATGTNWDCFYECACGLVVGFSSAKELLARSECCQNSFVVQHVRSMWLVGRFVIRGPAPYLVRNTTVLKKSEAASRIISPKLNWPCTCECQQFDLVQWFSSKLNRRSQGTHPVGPRRRRAHAMQRWRRPI